ncbi:MAG: hypothetical protein PVG14_17355 [Anaerolineales bacterium]|jgi:hypothetical protein
MSWKSATNGVLWMVTERSMAMTLLKTKLNIPPLYEVGVTLTPARAAERGSSHTVCIPRALTLISAFIALGKTIPLKIVQSGAC